MLWLFLALNFYGAASSYIGPTPRMLYGSLLNNSSALITTGSAASSRTYKSSKSQTNTTTATMSELLTYQQGFREAEARGEAGEQEPQECSGIDPVCGLHNHLSALTMTQPASISQRYNNSKSQNNTAITATFQPLAYQPELYEAEAGGEAGEQEPQRCRYGTPQCVYQSMPPATRRQPSNATERLPLNTTRRLPSNATSRPPSQSASFLKDVCRLWDDSCLGNRTLALNEFLEGLIKRKYRMMSGALRTPR